MFMVIISSTINGKWMTRDQAASQGPFASAIFYVF